MAILIVCLTAAVIGYACCVAAGRAEEMEEKQRQEKMCFLHGRKQSAKNEGGNSG